MSESKYQVPGGQRFPPAQTWARPLATVQSSWRHCEGESGIAGHRGGRPSRFRAYHDDGMVGALRLERTIRIRRAYRQEQGRRETDAQRKKQEPETVGNSASDSSVIARIGCLEGTVTDSPSALAALGSRLATFQNGRLPRRTVARVAASSSFAPSQFPVRSQSGHELRTVSRQTRGSPDANVSIRKCSISYANIQSLRLCRHIISRTRPISMFGTT